MTPPLPIRLTNVKMIKKGLLKKKRGKGFISRLIGPLGYFHFLLSLSLDHFELVLSQCVLVFSLPPEFWDLLQLSLIMLALPHFLATCSIAQL